MKHIKSINEMSDSTKRTFEEYVQDIAYELEDRFDLLDEDVEDVIDYYRDEIEDAFFGDNGYIKPSIFVKSLIKDGKLKWKK